MAKLRRSLGLQDHEDALLRTLYREFKIPIDQYPLRPDDLSRLVSTWNNLTGRDDSGPDLLHYMISRRKDNKSHRKGWEKLGRKAGGDFKPPQLSLSEDDLKQVDAIHEVLQVASDNYALDSDLAQRLQEEFARRTGRIVPAMVLAAAMIVAARRVPWRPHGRSPTSKTSASQTSTRWRTDALTTWQASGRPRHRSRSLGARTQSSSLSSLPPVSLINS
jgi:hypothetical protein